MSILRITKYGEKVLRRRSALVKDLNGDIQALIADMFETMYASGGVGLAGPQVNVPLRIAVVNPTPDYKENGFAIINPKIVKRTGRVDSEEGCLSLPGLDPVILKRASEVVVEATNSFGRRVIVRAEGLLSRCLQHEIDHLDGVMIVDRAPIVRRLNMLWTIRTMRKQGTW